MGRGRGRGRGKASVTASPVASAIEPSTPVVACMKTTYDGVDDKYSSTDAILKHTGELTVAFRLTVGNLIATPTTARSFTGNETYPSSGWTAHWYNGLFYLRSISTAAGIVTLNPAMASNTTYDVIGIISDTAMSVYFDSVLVATAAKTAGIALPTATFLVNGSTLGSISKYSLFDGVCTNPLTADVTDPSSFTGTLTTLIDSPNGSGTDNGQSLTFAKTGDPVIEAC